MSHITFDPNCSLDSAMVDSTGSPAPTDTAPVDSASITPFDPTLVDPNASPAPADAAPVDSASITPVDPIAFAKQALARTEQQINARVEQTEAQQALLDANDAANQAAIQAKVSDLRNVNASGQATNTVIATQNKLLEASFKKALSLLD